MDAGPGFTSYEWSTGATTQTVNNVGVGIYWVKLKTGECTSVQTVKIYPSELSSLYFPLLESAANKAGSRSEYAHLVTKMKMIVKDIPDSKTKIVAIAQALKAKYPRRPAMIEELNKILK